MQDLLGPGPLVWGQVWGVGHWEDAVDFADMRRAEVSLKGASTLTLQAGIELVRMGVIVIFY